METGNLQTESDFLFFSINKAMADAFNFLRLRMLLTEIKALNYLLNVRYTESVSDVIIPFLLLLQLNI